MNVVKISDGLGNQMFQYAFARKMQLRGNGRVYLDTRFINNEDRIARGEKAAHWREMIIGNMDWGTSGLTASGGQTGFVKMELFKPEK